MASKETKRTHERQLLSGKHRGSNLPFLDIFLEHYVEITGNSNDGHPCQVVYRAYRRFLRRLVGRKLRRGQVELPAGVHLLLGKGPREKFSQQVTTRIFSNNSRGNILVQKKRKACEDGSRPHWWTGIRLSDIPREPLRDLSSVAIPFYDAVRKYLECSSSPPINIHVSHDERAAGRCAFASRSVIEGEIVCEYKGELITSAVAAEREESEMYASKPASMFKIRDTEPKWLDPHGLDPEEAGPGHLINHSIENANLIPRSYKQRGEKPRLFLVANGCIAQGQEFLYNYNFPPDSRFPFLKDCQTYNPLGNFILDSDTSEDETQG